MDPASLGPSTVSLRVDASYVPITISWDSVERRVSIIPQRRLELFRTHTVRLESGIRARDGSPLDSSYSWQFRTLGIRLPESPGPTDRSKSESRFVRLSWSIGQVGSGPLESSLYAGTDSTAIATRSKGALAVGPMTSFVPREAWPSGVEIFWAVSVRNGTTGERRDGSVWSFRTLPADQPVDSVSLALDDWGYVWIDTQDGVMHQDCFSVALEVGGIVLKTAVRWDLRPFRGRKLAGATMVLSRGNRFRGRITTDVFASADYWSACDIQPDGAPHASERVGTATAGEGETMSFDNDVLAAHLEAMFRYQGYFGFVLQSIRREDLVPAGCRLILRFYSENPGAATAADARPYP
jgi:hypothetical protein